MLVRESMGDAAILPLTLEERSSLSKDIIELEGVKLEDHGVNNSINRTSVEG